MAKPEIIASAANPLVKDVRRAIDRGGLTSRGWCVAETLHLLEEALRSRSRVRQVLAAESVRKELPALEGIRVAILPDELMQKISATEASQGVIALVEPPVWTLEQLFKGCALVVALDGLQDPGNAGAIVRAAEAFGASGVIFLKRTASPFNPKTLRASAGSLFRVPFLHGMEPAVAHSAFRENRVKIYAAVPSSPGTDVRAIGDADLTAPTALLIGNEGRGVSSDWRGIAEGVSIPTMAVESLNAAMAAGILLYEARHQRSQRT
ncbi:MAG TPA: RNA methyltransferase [Bryobacteraceae bacterium]|nr:RNA methyltransferase [Bryobacteraceae bacterium]